MEITLKLFATLGDYLPEELNGRVRKYNELQIEVDEASTVQAVIEQFNVPTALAHLVQGLHVAPMATMVYARALRPTEAGGSWQVHIASMTPGVNEPPTK